MPSRRKRGKETSPVSYGDSTVDSPSSSTSTTASAFSDGNSDNGLVTNREMNAGGELVSSSGLITGVEIQDGAGSAGVCIREDNETASTSESSRINTRSRTRNGRNSDHSLFVVDGISPRKSLDLESSLLSPSEKRTIPTEREARSRNRRFPIVPLNDKTSRRRSNRISSRNNRTPDSMANVGMETPLHSGPWTRSQAKNVTLRGTRSQAKNVARRIKFSKITTTKGTPDRKRKSLDKKVEGHSSPKKKTVWCEDCGLRKRPVSGSRRPKRRIAEEDKRRSPRIYAKNLKFPFNFLPAECQMKIFSHLDMFDRGRCVTVCRSWCELIKSPSMWSVVDFSRFYICEHRRDDVKCSRTCRIADNYTLYIRNVCNFSRFLNRVKPAIKKLDFVFDIANEDEPWCVMLVRLLTAANCRELNHVRLDWTCTPQRPNFLDKFCCLFNKIRMVIHRHLFRQHPFGHIFGLLSLRAQGLRHLDIPFDWANWSVECLTRLTNLEVLALRRYVTFRIVKPSHLDSICSSMPHLKDLTLEIFTPVYHSRTLYKISHPNLRRLDISNSWGFFLKQLDLPNLHHFGVSRKHWEGPMVDVNTFPCLYTLLLDSSPQLQYINSEKLVPSWRTFIDYDLSVILDKVCPCAQHARVWDGIAVNV